MLVRIEPLSSFIATPRVSGSIGATTILTRGELVKVIGSCGKRVDDCGLRAIENYKYFLNVAAAMHTATPSSTALGSRISSGFTLTGSAR